jgi:hypothetical protein
MLHEETNLKINRLMKTYDQKSHSKSSLNRLYQSSCQNLLSTSDNHHFPILIRNLEFNHLSESLGNPLQLLYSEFPQVSHGKRPKPQFSQVRLFCPKIENSINTPQLSEVITLELLGI